MHRTILVAEDDHALRDVLVRQLREENYDTIPAPDGATALRLATTGICAAVLDVGLPDADGRDVCHAMGANGFLSPVIFLTARHRLADRLSGYSGYSGFSACTGRTPHAKPRPAQADPVPP